MNTKFSEFKKEEYKKIRKTILKFSKEQTHNQSFSVYMRNDYSSETISILNKLLIEEYSMNIDDFFTAYKDKIYKDDKFTCCCGFLDVLLYNFDDTYKLGGKQKWYQQDFETKYKYGFQNTNLGMKYIKQHFDNMTDFYKGVIEQLLEDKYLFKKNCYKEIVEDIDDCVILFTHMNSVVDEDIPNFDILYVDDIFILIVGDSYDVEQIIRKFDDYDEDIKIEEFDFEDIKSNIRLSEDAKKYNL